MLSSLKFCTALRTATVCSLLFIATSSQAQWSVAHLSQPESSLRSTSVGNKAFFTVGGHLNVFDASNNSWSTTSLSQARGGVAAASISDKALFGGGIIANTTHSTIVDIYDQGSGTWSTGQLSQGRSFAAAAGTGNKVLFAGGSRGIGVSSYSNVVDIYNATNNTWSAATLTQAKTGLAGAAAGTKVLFAGGENATGFSSSVDIYDVVTGVWTTANLTQARTALTATSAGTKILFAGGYYYSTVTSSLVSSTVVDIYDTSTNTWSTATLPVAKQYLSSTSIGNKVFFAGGGSPSGRSNTVAIYDITTGAWTAATLSQARDRLTATSAGTKAIFAGGSTGADSNVVDIYDSGSPTAGPVITSFTPTKGQSGTVVTITGLNFSPTPANNIVKFNNVTASVSASSATSITTTVPGAATTGPITVTVASLTGTSSSNFVICPAILVQVSTSNKSSFTSSATGGLAPYSYSLDGVNFQPSGEFTLPIGEYTITARDANGCTGVNIFKINGIVDCSVTQAAGGQGTTFTTHVLGTGSGLVKLTYEMFSIPDQMDVYYDNVLVASTNSLVSGQGTLQFSYSFNPAKPTFCVIRLYAPNQGTEWNYAALCPDPYPSITTFTPTFGNVGTVVTITGSNFVPGTTVHFGSIPASSPTINPSGTQMTVTVPSGAVTAPITISNSLGQLTTAASFVVSAYCFSGATADLDSRITKVILNNLNNTSPSACETYSDYSGMAAVLSAGQTYDLKITLGTCNGNYTKAVKAFIDWNGDLDFVDAGETVATTVTANNTTREETFSITVPVSPVVSNTRLRVVLREIGTPASITPCGTFNFGETEDYSIVLVSGATPTKYVGRTSLNQFSAPVGGTSPVQSFSLTGANLGTNAFTITAPAQFQVSSQAATGFSSSITVTPVTGSVTSTVYVRYVPTSAGGHTGSISISNSLFGSASFVAVTGNSTVALPHLVTYASLDNFLSTGVGLPSPSQTFRVTGKFLTGNVLMTAPTGFGLSLSTSSFTPTLSISPVSGEIVNQTIYVRYTPAAVGTQTGNIELASTGVTTQVIPVTGTIRPVISGFTPTSGPPGTIVTISGSNYSAASDGNGVKFNFTSATVNSNTTTSIVAVVPTGATTGRITITTGNQSASSASNFTVTTPPVPTITGFSPPVGAIGASITITGTNFSTTPGNNTVRFNGVPGIVTASTSTSITVTIPPDATSGPLTVIVNGQTATSIFAFTIVKASQTITFATLLPKTFGGPKFTLDATASSGLPVIYISSDPTVASVTGNEVTIVAAGTANITASQPGNNSYNPAPPVTRTLTVEKSPQLITFSALGSKPFDTPAFMLAATVSSGLPLTLSSSNALVATVSGNTLTVVGIGTSTIAASQPGNANYLPALPVEQVLTITKANQTITFSDIPPKAPTDGPFPLAVSASSGLAVGLTSSNPNVATISGGTVTLTGVIGTSSIVATQTGNNNYNAAPTITKELSVKNSQTFSFASLPTKTFNDPPFTISAQTATGLDVTFVSSNPTVATIAGNTVTITGAGTTTISATVAGNAVFHPATVAQQLTVLKASQTISFGPLAAKVIGDAPFTISATATSGQPVSFTTSSDKITIAGTQVTLVKVGSATIVAAQQGNTNYEAAPNLSVSICVNPVKPSITASGISAGTPVLTSNTSTGNQWQKNGVAIDGAVNGTYTPTESGVFTLVTTVDGCSSAASDPVNIVFTGVEDSIEGISIYPNPVVNELVIESSVPVSVVLYDATGRALISTNPSTQSILDFKGHAPGTYLLKLQDRERIIFKRVVKR